MAAEQHDALLMMLAQRSSGIDEILDAFFGFLGRKTDFFTAAEDRVEAAVLGALRKQMQATSKKDERKVESKPAKSKPAAPKAAQTKVKAVAAPPVVEAADGVFDISDTVEAQPASQTAGVGATEAAAAQPQAQTDTSAGKPAEAPAAESKSAFAVSVPC